MDPDIEQPPIYGGPKYINRQDIVRASLCSRSVYKDIENILHEFTGKASHLHNFTSICSSRHGQMRFVIAKTVNCEEIFIAFKGTSNYNDILTDITALPLGSGEFEGSCHLGFNRLANEFQTDAILEKYPSSRIVVCGHSLGGALAQIITLEMKRKLQTIGARKRLPKISCITFGSPLVFTKGVVDYIDKFNFNDYFVNIVSQNDPVPRILLLAETLKALTSVVNKASGWLKSYIIPLLDVFSLVPWTPIATTAAVASAVTNSTASAFSEWNKFQKKHNQEFEKLLDVYKPIGWFLFLNFKDSLVKNCPLSWEAKYVNKEIVIQKFLSSGIDNLDNNALKQHGIGNYCMVLETALKPYHFDQKTEEGDGLQLETNKTLLQTTEFSTVISRLYLTMTDCPSKDQSVKQLQIKLTGDNLTFLLKDECTIEGPPFPKFGNVVHNNINIMDATPHSATLIALVDTLGIWNDILRLKLVTQFDVIHEICNHKTLQAINARTLSDVLVDGLNPQVLFRAYKRGLANVCLKQKPDHRMKEVYEDPILCLLYSLERYNSKLKDNQDTKLKEIAKECARSKTLKFSDLQENVILKVCDNIKTEMKTHLKVRRPWTWGDVATATVMTTGTVSAIGLTGGAAALFFGSAAICGQVALAMGGGGTMLQLGTGAMAFWTYSQDLELCEKSYKGVLRLYIEALPATDKEDQLLRNLETNYCDAMEKALYEKCTKLGYIDDENRWGNIEELAKTKIFENSEKFKGILEGSIVRILKHIKACCDMCFLRRILKQTYVVGVMEMPSRKGTVGTCQRIVNQLWNTTKIEEPFDMHAVDSQTVTLHRIDRKLMVMNIFTSPNMSHDEIAKLLNESGVIANVYLCVIPYSVCMDDDSYKGVLIVSKFYYPMLICFNIEEGDASYGKSDVSDLRKKLHEEVGQRLRNHLQLSSEMDARLPQYDVQITDLRKDVSKPTGSVWGVEQIQMWIHDHCDQNE